MSCPDCMSTDVYAEKGYASLFRCAKCNRVGSEKDFE